ncbi:MAG: hypothetical protein AAF677_14540 [Pseudomonadota bacterium]
MSGEAPQAAPETADHARASAPPTRWVAILAGGALALLAVYAAYETADALRTGVRDLRRAGWREAAAVLNALRWPVAGVVAILGLSLIRPLVDGILAALYARRR